MPTKRAYYIYSPLDKVTNFLVVGGSLGIHGQTKRVSCPRRICTDLTFFLFVILSHLFPLHDLVHLFDVFSRTPFTLYPTRICRIAFSCLLYPIRTPSFTPIVPPPDP